MAAQIATQSPAFVLCAGDNILGFELPGSAGLAQQYTNWKTAMAPILGISYPVRGNHEAFGLLPGTTPQVNFNAEVGRGNSTAQSVNASLRYEF